MRPPWPKPPIPARNHFNVNPAGVMVGCALALTALGLTVLFSASASFKQGPYYFLDKQIVDVEGAKVVRVNDPLSVAGFTFHENGYRPADPERS